MKLKNVRFLLVVALAALLQAAPAYAQDKRRDINVMEYVVVGKDTIYLDEIPPAVIHPRKTMNRRDWVQYYKRVHNFSKAYPYALLISQVINSTDSLFIADNYTRRQQDKGDVVIRPDASFMGLLKITNYEESVSAGRQKAVEALPRIRALLGLDAPAAAEEKSLPEQEA